MNHNTDQEKKLEKLAYWYESILDATPSPITVTDKDMKWTFVNKAVEDFLGVKREDIIGKPCSDWNAHICNTDACGIACAKRGVNRTFFEQNGRSHQVDVAILKDIDGETSGFVEVVQDITDIKEMEKIRESDERIQVMLDTSPFAAHFWDENFNMVDCNLAAVKLFDLSSKEEYIEKYFDLTPEFQPDGMRSKDKLRLLIKKTYETGSHRYEWMRQKLDGEPIPVEITMVCVEYNGKNLIVSHCRDLREQKRMMQDIEKRDALLNVINDLAVILLAAADEVNFEKSLLKGMELIGQSVDADCVQVWPNKMINGVLHFTLQYKWLSEIGKKAPDVPVGTAVPYPARWTDLFSRGECVNGPIAELPQVDQDLLFPLGLTSTITIPLYYQDKFWGILCVDDCIKERYFTDGEIGILRSAALMIVNAINRNQQDAQLREESKRTQLLLDTSPIAAHFWDENHNMVDCNQAAVNLFNLTSKEEYIERYFELTPEFQPDGQRSTDRLKELINETYETGYNRSEWMRQSLNGDPIPVEVTYVRVEYMGKSLIASYCRDLREHKKIMQELQTAQITTAAMFESNPHINILFDSSFKVIDCNPAAVQFVGFETKEAFIDGFMEKISASIPEYQSDGRKSGTLKEKIHITVTEGYTRFETEIILGGERKTLDVEFKKIPYQSSFAIVGYIFDMTDIREREAELSRIYELNALQLTKLNAVVRATKIGIWDVAIVDNDPVNPANVFTWSDEFRHLLGYTDETDFPNVAESYFGNLHPEDAEIATNAIMNHIKDKTGNTPYDVEYRLIKKNGEYSFFRTSGETIRDKDGNAIRVAGALMDITETKNILLDTERQKIEAEAANKAKSVFLSTMSHEIRTPMNAILGITEINLQKDDLDEGIRAAFEKIYVSGDLLLGIINDILDLSKIEAGKMGLDVNRYEIASLISDTAQLNMMRVGSKPIEFELDIDAGLPAYILGDELRVKQILNNLLSNAFKYTAKGTVTLAVTSKPSEEKEDEIILTVSVSDTGQGMSKEQVSKLFDEYSRFNTEANRSTEGTGLGMSITQKFLKLMNGTISVESEPDVGSTFTVCIPQGKISDDVLGDEMVENLHLFRTQSRAQMRRVQITRDPMPYGSVLIVDDVETNIYVAKGLLVPYGLKIDSVESGFAAIDRIKNGSVYDIVFMDHMMPKMDGVETTKIIRDMGYDRPIVALTANAVAGQADIFRKNGFDDFLSKPIDIRQLNFVLNKLIRDKQTPEVIASAKNQAESKEPAAAVPDITEFFIGDASRSIKVLDEIATKNDYNDEDNIQTYIINVHGMKSALANIGKMDLSAVALKLEAAGREGKHDIIVNDTPLFISSLRSFVDELMQKNKKAAIDPADDDKEFLREKLLVIKDACDEYDDETADEALIELRAKQWSQQSEEILSNIAELLLHSAFDKVVETIDGLSL